jgi:hypothetical protein
LPAMTSEAVAQGQSLAPVIQLHRPAHSGIA